MKENPNVRSESAEDDFETASDTIILISLAVEYVLFISTFSLSVIFLHFAELDIKQMNVSLCLVWGALESSPAVLMVVYSGQNRIVQGNLSPNKD